MPVLTWNAGTFAAAIADKVERGVGLAAAAITTDVKRELNVIGHREASEPGQPPHLQRGDLEVNVDFAVKREVDKIRGTIGVHENVAYARRLELGFAGVDSLGRHYDQAPRPFLRPALLRARERTLSIIASEALK